MRWDGAVLGVPDASVVTVSSLPDRLPGGLVVGPHSQARSGALLRVVPNVARFMVTGGERIEVASEQDADPANVLSYLHGGVRAALIHQRGDLPLHATTVLPPRGDGAVAICGNSGMGKSTLAAALVRQGWALISDDLTRVTWDEQTPLAWPGSTGIKLMIDAADRLGLLPESLERTAAGKVLMPVPANLNPVRLSSVIALRDDPTLSWRVLKGAAALAMLTQQTFRLHYVAALGVTTQHLQMTSRLAGACLCTSLSRRFGVSALPRMLQTHPYSQGLDVSSARIAPSAKH
ncbi:MAG TPA: hypothetical protein VI653_25460 [Steroidobacteraceae bacterium]